MKVNLNIDNKTYSVSRGLTIMEAARKVGIEIPSLCHMKLHDVNIENKPAGCRICVVEVAGRKNLVPACCSEV